jgi:cytochrome b6-f complex iron-sulfur subunit
MTGTAALAVSTLSPSAVVLIIILVIGGVFLLILGNSLRRGRKSAGPAAATPPPDVDGGSAAKAPAPVSRRDFFRGGMLASLGAFVAVFGGASLAFLWPNLKGGFGSVIEAGSLGDIKGFIAANNQPFYYGAGRFYIVPYHGDGTDTVYAGITAEGLMALYQKCVHLGCRVPFCQTSQWFECPCHGSKYNEAGEYQLGPAPTGLNRFKIIVEGDKVLVDTSNIIPGPPRGTNTTHQSPEGPFCV